MTNRTALMLSLTLALLAAGCSETTRTSMQQDVERARQGFLDQAESRMDMLESMTGVMQLRLENAAGGVRDRYRESVNALVAEREALQARLAELRAQAETVQDETRASIQAQIKSLEDRYNQALDALKTD